jgi:hypothetical protein
MAASLSVHERDVDVLGKHPDTDGDAFWRHQIPTLKAACIVIQRERPVSIVKQADLHFVGEQG